jgi:hypothetical protein
MMLQKYNARQCAHATANYLGSRRLDMYILQYSYNFHRPKPYVYSTLVGNLISPFSRSW